MKKRKIMLVTMATPISSHVKDKNSIFTMREMGYDLFSRRKNPGISSVYIYNEINYYKVTHIA